MPRREKRRRSGSDMGPQDQQDVVMQMDAPRDHDATGVSCDAILDFLAEHPNLDDLLAQHPGLTVEGLQACFARAGTTMAGPKPERHRKGAHQTVVMRTHGLPAPDGVMHKGNIFRTLLAPLTPGRLLDLGAGKGNFALSAAYLGWQVTAVDARTVRWPDADAEPDPVVAERIRSIRWVQGDVRDFPIAQGDYELICILGLLHHLEVADQATLLRRCAGTLLLLDTRIAPAIVDRVDGHEGMLIREHGQTREEQDQVATAAWGNAVSFQHTEESLLRLLRDCGYPQVMPMRPPHRPDYTFYLCLPGPGSTRRRQARTRHQHSRPSQTEQRNTVTEDSA